MRRRTSAFTMVELMIVLVVLGILAMLVMPEYSSASADAKESSLATNLQSLTRQVELYRLEHGSNLPCIDHAGRYDPSTARFMQRMTSKTDNLGKVTADGQFGPYLIEWPPNPFSDPTIADTILFGTAEASPRNGKTGWYFNTKTGVISPNSAKGLIIGEQGAVIIQSDG